MKPHAHQSNSARLPFLAAMSLLFLLGSGCSKVYEGPYIPEEEPQSFSGSVGTEIVSLGVEKVSALDGMVTLSYGAVVPDKPVEVFVATFPVQHMELPGYLTTGRGYHLSYTNPGIGIVMELKYDENHLKSISDHFHEEDLTILMINSGTTAAGTSEILPIGPCQLDTKGNVVSTTIYGSGTFVVGAE